MGLVAVTRQRHPVMAEALTRDDIYGGFRIAIYNLFNQPLNSYTLNQKEFTLIPDECKLLKFVCLDEPRSSIYEKIDPDKPLTINYFTTTSWLQKIAFPLKKVNADQSRV